MVGQRKVGRIYGVGCLDVISMCVYECRVAGYTDELC